MVRYSHTVPFVQRYHLFQKCYSRFARQLTCASFRGLNFLCSSHRHWHEFSAVFHLCHRGPVCSPAIRSRTNFFFNEPISFVFRSFLTFASRGWNGWSGFKKIRKIESRWEVIDIISSGSFTCLLNSENLSTIIKYDRVKNGSKNVDNENVNFLENNRDRYIILDYVRVFEFLYSNFTFTLTNKEIFLMFRENKIRLRDYTY